MQNPLQYNTHSYEVYDIQEELISTAENGEVYAIDYGEVETLSYLNGILTQINFEMKGRGSWVLKINNKCSLFFYFSRCLTNDKDDFSYSSIFWRGEYTRISGKTELITGTFSIEEVSGRVKDSEVLGEEIIDRIRDFLDEVDRLIEIDNFQIRSKVI